MTIQLSNEIRAKLSKKQLAAIDSMTTAEETDFILLLMKKDRKSLVDYMTDSLQQYREHDADKAAKLLTLIDVQSKMVENGYRDEFDLILNFYAIMYYNGVKTGSDESYEQQRKILDRELQIAGMVTGGDK